MGPKPILLQSQVSSKAQVSSLESCFFLPSAFKGPAKDLSETGTHLECLDMPLTPSQVTERPSQSSYCDGFVSRNHFTTCSCGLWNDIAAHKQENT